MLIDTHAHLDEQSFQDDLDNVLKRASDAGVESILTIGVTLATSQAAVKLARQFPQLHAVVGIQPNYASQAHPGDFEQIALLATDPAVVAIGETGLDRYWDFAPIDVQEEYFIRHIELAQEQDLPFVVHCRDAEEDVVRVLSNCAAKNSLRGVMHSFCGSHSIAQKCLELGLHISFAGMVTFKKNAELRDVARQIPIDRLLVETDSPYLAPVPLRGKRNEPANVVHTARCLADLHGLPLDEFSALVTANSKTLFRLK